MGLISFLTVGEDEVRAWTIKKNTPAKAAAGKIHTDLERSFIRAEVIPYEEFMTVRSMQEAKSRGMVKVVGKEEIVKDGDIFHVWPMPDFTSLKLVDTHAHISFSSVRP